jgi:hypothetical protein
MYENREPKRLDRSTGPLLFSYFVVIFKHDDFGQSVYLDFSLDLGQAGKILWAR